MGKKEEVITAEHILEAEERSLLDHKNFLALLSEPYLCLLGNNLPRLTRAINILAEEKGYRAINISQGWGVWTVLMEKEQQKKS